MKYALNLGENGRVLSATFAKFAKNGAVLVDNLPDSITDYLFKDGEFIYSPLPVEEEEVKPTTNERLKDLESKFNAFSDKLKTLFKMLNISIPE